MRERGIIFSTPMVKAILDGRKTQTRRIVKLPSQEPQTYLGLNGAELHVFAPGGGKWGGELYCPYGKVGDRLWVRETWGIGSRPDEAGGYDGIEYKADIAYLESEHDLLGCYKVEPPDDVCLSDYSHGWKPSIHMPRWASRITLEIVGVRVERLQDISVADALAEGIVCPSCGYTLIDAGLHGDHALCVNKWLAECKVRPHHDHKAIVEYRQLWDSIHGTGAFDENPFVWVIGFKSLEAGELK